MTEPPGPPEDERRRDRTLLLRTRIPLGRWIVRLWKGADGGGEGVRPSGAARRSVQTKGRIGSCGAIPPAGARPSLSA